MRILLLLLIALLATPAVAGKHCAPPAARAEAHMGHAGGDHDAPPAHGLTQPDCIGCIAPIDGPGRIALRARCQPPLALIAPPAPIRAGLRAAPATPPPKLSA